jgi:hypothetical protein
MTIYTVVCSNHSMPNDRGWTGINDYFIRKEDAEKRAEYYNNKYREMHDHDHYAWVSSITAH